MEHSVPSNQNNQETEDSTRIIERILSLEISDLTRKLNDLKNESNSIRNQLDELDSPINKYLSGSSSNSEQQFVGDLEKSHELIT